MLIKYEVKDNKYSSINKLLKEEFCFSSSYIKALNLTSSIKINEDSNFINRKNVNIGDVISIDLSDCFENSENIVPIKMDLDILYEDDFLLIVNKPSNTAVHPSILHYEDSLSNGIKNYFLEKKLNIKIRPINRLDRDTSGIVIFAKFPFIQNYFAIQMKKGLYNKKYLGIVEGCFSPENGLIDAPIVRKENSIIERKIDTSSTDSSAQAITYYNTLKIFNKYSLVEYILKTGRTHQIRVHSAYKGHPLLGDTLYGNSTSLIERQSLHCYSLDFIHPISHNKIHITAPIPDDMQKLLS